MAFVVFLLILAMANGSGANWCICRSDVSDAALQKTLDYACGAGADCTPLLSSGACYQPNTLKSHCSYAVNSYYQKKLSTGATCDFSGTAIQTSTDPSSSATCIYPATPSAAGGTTTTPTTTPTTTTPTTTPTTTSPNITPPTTFTPTTGIIGVNPSLGPSGIGSNSDFSGGFSRLDLVSLFFTLWSTGLVQWALLRG